MWNKRTQELLGSLMTQRRKIMMNKIYDTNTLLLLGESVFSFTHFYVSSITFNELEHIKTANNKDNEIKYKAR